MKQWTETLHVAQFRIARPTDQLEQIERFYCEGLGLKKLGGFKGHRGYTGIMIGLPDASYHLDLLSMLMEVHVLRQRKIICSFFICLMSNKFKLYSLDSLIWDTMKFHRKIRIGQKKV